MKKPYERPVLTVRGDIREITRGSWQGPFDDGGFIFKHKVIPDPIFS